MTAKPIALLLAVGLVACSSQSKREATCIGGKCDDPGAKSFFECDEQCGTDEDCFFQCMEEASLGHCEARRDTAMSPSRPHFTPTAARWACQDVPGVNSEFSADRGQEYCEYFAVVDLPPRNSNHVNNVVKLVGKAKGVDPETETNVSTDLELDLSTRQRTELETMDPNAVVGQCIFTSWHQDTPGPLNVCVDPNGCPEVFGHFLDDEHDVTRIEETGGAFDFTEPLFRMTFEVNSNRAAAALVADCLTEPVVDDFTFFFPDEQDDPFMRGCMVMSPVGETALGTEWRRSDSTVCAASMRMFECGCGVDTDRDGSPDIFGTEEIANILVPEQPEIDDNGEEVVRMRGFPLGGWDDANALPRGCSYLDPEERTVVGCDLRARDVLGEQDDLKGFCGERFGPVVVAHVPLPDGFIVCEPDDTSERAKNCGFKPWIVDNEEQEGFTNCDHDVCTIGASMDASCGSCEAKICDVDPFCCEVSWNRFCTAKVESICGQSCDDACLLEHDVCEEGDPLDPECSDCAKDVCEEDPFCCVTGWNQFCTAKVDRICGQTCN